MAKKKKAGETSGADNSQREHDASGDYVERRRTARLDVPIKVEYRALGKKGDADPRAAISKDLSAGGCLLLTNKTIDVNSDVELNIYLGEGESEALKIKGTIVRINRQEKGLFEYGISFDQISREARRLFADFCFAKMYEMIGLSGWPTDRRTK